MSAEDNDSLHAFDFERLPVRGKLVHLNASWRAVLERKSYPDAVSELLGQSLAASVLLGSTLKFDGKLTLQLQSDGPVSLLLSQSTSNQHVRGLAHVDDARVSDQSTFTELMQNGRLALTLEPDGDGQRYQGIVPLEAASFAACVEQYFAASEQLPTRLWFASNGRRVVGMLLQQMPDTGGTQKANDDPDAWPRLQMLADTITSDELLELSDKEILHRLFHEEDVRLFESSPVSFQCSCSDERIHSMLRGLGRDEVLEIINEQGEVSVDCEFCGRRYQLDLVDAEQLFSGSAPITPSQTH